MENETRKDTILQLAALSGEVSEEALRQLDCSEKYLTNLLLELRNNQLIKRCDNDDMTGYRLSQSGKRYLMTQYPERYGDYFRHGGITSKVRLDSTHRYRYLRMSEVNALIHTSGSVIYPGCKPPFPQSSQSSQPVYYTSFEFKNMGDLSVKINSSRAMGLLRNGGDSFLLYNTHRAPLKWEDMTEYPEENRNMGEVYKLLTVSSESGLNKLFGVLPMSHPSKAPYNIFKQAAESVRGGIIIGLGSRLQVFQNQLICEMTGCDDIDLELPGRQKCAYFCITSDQDSTFDFLSSLFFSFLFIKLVRYADKHCAGGKLTVPTTFVCDEFPNIGTIPDFCKKISTVRSRGLNISIIFQNLAQLQNRYPQNQWQEILGNCDTQLFLGCTDELTATFISNRTGDVTIGVSSKAKQLSTWRVSNYTPDYRETSSIGKRKLLTPDEVLRLPLDKALVILRGQKVLKVDKFDYTLHPDSKKLTPCKAVEHIPKRNVPAETGTEEPEREPVRQAKQETEKKPNTVDAKPNIEAVDLNDLFKK